jgi:hypothetical protein
LDIPFWQRWAKVTTLRTLAIFSEALFQLEKRLGGLTEPVVIVAIWRINREVVHGQSAVSGEAAPMLHVLSS